LPFIFLIYGHMAADAICDRTAVGKAPQPKLAILGLLHLRATHPAARYLNRIAAAA
jgi:hypothetical protein